jgi:hypothetical protein
MRSLALAAALVLGLARPSLAAVELEVMAATGQKVGAHQILAVEAPYVGPNGEAAFVGWVGKSRAILYWREGELRVAARDGAPATGLPAGLRFNGVTLIGFDGDGRLYFSSDVFSSAQKIYFGVWSYDPPARKRALLVAAPKTYPGVGRLERVGSPSIGSAGHLAFIDHSERLLLRAPDGTMTVVAAPGDAAPGAPGFTFVHFNSPFRVGAGGELGFNAVADDGGPDPATGVWKRAAAGPISLVGMKGGQAPGAAPGSAFQTVAVQDGNAAGALSLEAMLEPGTGDVDALNAACVLGPTAGVETILARSNDPAPGIPGALFDSFAPGPHLDTASRVLFRAALQVGPGGVTADDDGGLWLSDGAGGIDLLLQVGHALPGEPDALLGIYHAVQGKGGDVAVSGPLGPAGSADLSMAGLVGIASGGAPVVVIRDGDTVELAPGVPSLPGFYLLATTYPSYPDARAVDGGKVAFQGFFADGKTAAVLATLPVPEPGQGAQLLTGALVLYLARKKRGVPSSATE